MQVTSSTGTLNPAKNIQPIKTLFTEKISKDEAMEIREQIKQNSNAMAFNSTSIQGGIKSADDIFAKQYDDFQSFLKNIGYEGKPIAELSKEEAAELVSEDGFFGIEQTSTRIAEFVINGGGNDESRLRAGREGMIQGFKEAEAMWGGELPEISQKTMQKAIEMVDKAMYDLGFSILDKEA
ncbi:MAG: hypothetical protein A2513_08950 [Sulfurimonas sp. RIFOXYD12_FULL_33_39]|uniref:hypothetical protein n=1 Tax=unclassified Sulfurimonas TaxID=2623549 RepID=UPI0008CD80F3|nr:MULTISPECIES: hypothetical protein [unclassified Sulfurimonas]OHE07096.1 MAG: hypothetical protein A3G74_01570 [Sulfurimonas sp. RIFCSPLOWO2_12_FULL_34_6]OHE10209.1 MAG: hypothetical protein A2513_08950 [Sulfurimonas sp. RIFOXYD12_FULL_33_39]OHE14570.1 MAG: hypothetical protein A2530_01530 [Sulfurimonas sp. RIFOXYD2_FULL_34_21]DAB28335.1 MAG TPA: hypothetical protein CFH78_03075 [Sulfurimonas sp. UBA10385]